MTEAIAITKPAAVGFALVLKKKNNFLCHCQTELKSVYIFPLTEMGGVQLNPAHNMEILPGCEQLEDGKQHYS